MESGRTLTWSSGRPFEAASVIKLALLVEAAARAREGTLDMTDRWTLTASGVAAGSGVLDEFEPGLMPTQRDLLRLMIARSDNTAANSFIDRFGRDAVNARMEGLGLGGIRLVGRIPTRGEEPDRWPPLGTMTPADVAELYRRIATLTLLDSASDRLLLEILQTQRVRDRIPRLLIAENGVLWAGKSGTMSGVRNDSGILTTKKGRFVLVVFVGDIPDRPGATSRVNETMGEIGAAIVRDWSRGLPDLPPPPQD